MATLTAIITAHDDTPWCMIDNLDKQTRHPDEIIVGVSDWWPFLSNDGSGNLPKPGTTLNVLSRRSGGPDVYVEMFKNMNDYGYHKRNELLKRAACDYVGFFNHDDSYDLTYIEKMMGALEAADADVAWCRWDENNHLIGAREMNAFEPFYSTVGNFFVRTELFRKIGGFPFDEVQRMVVWAAGAMLAGSNTELMIDPTATGEGWLDAAAITRLLNTTDKIVKVDERLYHHNVPYDPTLRPSVWGEKR
jgi:glycosyl transferase family 2